MAIYSILKALVICGASVSDVVFATPILRALKVQLDDLDLHVLVDLPTAFILDENPYVDQIHFFNLSFWQSRKRFKVENFNYVINLREDWRSHLLASLVGKKTYAIKSLWWNKWLMVNLKIDHLPNLHLVSRMMNAVEPLQLKQDELGLDYFIPEKDRVFMEWLPEPFHQGYYVFCIHAAYNTRKLTVDRMIELCDKINKPIVVLGVAEDAATGELLSGFFGKAVSVSYQEGLLQLNKKTVVYNACGKFNFNQMASVVKQSRGVFTFDNEFIPVASAFKKEIFGLWGNTILLFGRYPYRTKFTVFENNRVTCRPCTTKGFDKCPKGHFKCMQRIVFDFYLP